VIAGQRSELVTRAIAKPSKDGPRLARQKTRDTTPELILRLELHRRGLRYFVHRKPMASLRRESDILFPRARVAVFVDGCFWHGCPEHGTWPSNNGDFWREKIEGNVIRDADTDASLQAEGWTVIRIWEHDATVLAADQIEEAVRNASQL
jgi:DNA mismatch endonuclease (patch repair protein)